MFSEASPTKTIETMSDEKELKDHDRYLKYLELSSQPELLTRKSQIISSGQKTPELHDFDIDCKGLQENKFRSWIFLEFSAYFLLSQWLGPLNCFLFIWKKEARALAYNLRLYGRKELLRIFIWLIRIYCFILTFVLNNYESEGQFWLVIYTDISLSVLYGAYYSSFTETEIKSFRTKYFDPGSDITKKLVDLVNQERTRAFERRVLITRFPQIDVNNFYFVFPQRYRHVIPQFLEPKHINEAGETIKKTMIKDGFFLRAEKFAAYVIDKAGHRSIDKIVIGVKIISRIIIFFRILLPIGSNIYNNIHELDELPKTPTLVLYIVQQLFYSFFLYTFAQVYDVLFLGLVLNYRKFVLLRKLKKTIDTRPTTTFKSFLKIIPAVPKNVENWLNLRRVMARMNIQASVIIDTNMSFALLYSVIFIIVYGLYTIDLLETILNPIRTLLSNNPVLQATIFFTLAVMVIVLAIHLVLGIHINGLFSDETQEWSTQLSIVKSLEQSQKVYENWFEEEHKTIENFEEGDEFVERVDDIKSLLREDFRKNFKEFLGQLKNVISIVLDGLKYEESYNSHRLLGLNITPQLLSLFAAFASTVGLSAINDIVSNANKINSY